MDDINVDITVLRDNAVQVFKARDRFQRSGLEIRGGVCSKCRVLKKSAAYNVFSLLILSLGVTQDDLQFSSVVGMLQVLYQQVQQLVQGVGCLLVHHEIV